MNFWKSVKHVLSITLGSEYRIFWGSVYLIIVITILEGQWL